MGRLQEMNNVILFPTLRRNLEQIEEESYELIEEQNYEQALEKLNILLSHQYTSFEINMNMLHCLTKLKRWKEAEEFNEMLLEENDEFYYDYFGYYLMILYEQNNFSAIMKTILEEEKNAHIPPPYHKKFKDIYRLCYQMNMMKANDLLNNFEIAIREENHKEQLHYLHKWIQLHVEPSEIIVDALKSKKVHPVVKTKILKVLKDKYMKDPVIIEKFGQEKEIHPSELVSIKEQTLYQKTLEALSDIEQNDPTLYFLIEQLLYQYHYIHYPFLIDETEDDRLTKAFIDVGKKHLSLIDDVEDDLKEEVKAIEICSQLYLNILEQ